MVNGDELARAGCRFLGTPYSVMDCQAFVEACLKQCGLQRNLAGSNAWYREVRKNGWVGSPEECQKTFGIIPKGAFLFILKNDGREPEKYKQDGIGNASHIGIYTGMTGKEMVSIGKADGDEIAGGYNYGNGAINSSSVRAAVCTSRFEGKSIKGGWNQVGLWTKKITYSGISGTGGKTEMKMKVTTSGGPLNLRGQPSRSASLIYIISNGTVLDIIDSTPGWAKVEYQGKTGWVSTDYLTAVDEKETVSVDRAELEKIYDMIGNWLGLRG